MGYGRLGPTAPPPPPSAPGHSSSCSRRPRLMLLCIALSIILLAVAATLLILSEPHATGSRALGRRQPSKAIAKACQKTRYPTLCVDSLVDFPGALAANEPDLVHMSVNLTLQRFGRALYATSDLMNLPMDTVANGII